MSALQTSPLVSVIVPVWPEDGDAEATLRSVRDQDHGAIEIVVVEGGSGARAASVIRGFLQQEDVRARFERVLFVDEAGISTGSAAFNRGLQECRGDYVNILAAGDAFAPQRFSRLLRASADGNVELLFSRVEVLADATQVSSRAGADLYSVQDEIELFPTVGYAFLRGQCAICTENLFFSRRLAGRVSGFAHRGRLAGWDFALRCLLLTEPVFVPEPLYRHRLRPGGSGERNSESARDRESVLKNYLFHCRTRPVLNPLAPSPAWDPFFASFIAVSHYGRYLTQP